MLVLAHEQRLHKTIEPDVWGERPVQRDPVREPVLT